MRSMLVTRAVSKPLTSSAVRLLQPSNMDRISVTWPVSKPLIFSSARFTQL